MVEINESSIYFLYGVIAFCYCLNIATLLFVFYLCIDIYHRRWLEKMDKIEEIIGRIK